MKASVLSLSCFRLGAVAGMGLIGFTAVAQLIPALPLGPGRPGFSPDRSAIAGSGISTLSGSTVAYDNLLNPLGHYLGGFPHAEVGDDFALGPGPRTLESITVAYAGFNFSGDETLTMTIYRMDGPPTPGSFGFNTPGTALFSVTQPITATDGATLTFIDGTGTIMLPDYVGVGISFGGIEFDPTGAGADAGPLLYDPPSPGSSFEDFWLRGFPSASDPWSLYTFGGLPPINLGIQIATTNGFEPVIPESETWLALGGVLVFAAMTQTKRFRRRW